MDLLELYGERDAALLKRYIETGLTPEQINRLNTFVGSQVEKLLADNAAKDAEIARLKDDLESAQARFSIEYIERKRAEAALAEQKNKLA